MNFKGGSEKTSLAVHLVSIAHEQGVKCCLIDTDPTAGAKRWSEVGELPFECRSAGKRDLARVVRDAGKANALVIIDTPAVMEDIAMSALAEADLVLIPMHTGSGDID